MRRSSSVFGVLCGLLSLLFEPEKPCADIPPPPLTSVKMLPSSGCPMKELERAVSSQRDDLNGCLRRARARGDIVIHCTFDEAGKMIKCEPAPKKKDNDGYSKADLACITKVLFDVRIDPKFGDPAKCTARIEIRSEAQPHRRPNRRREIMMVF